MANGIEQRLILITAGETVSTRQNRFHSAATDDPLTKKGKRRMDAIANYMIGPGKFIDPANVKKVYCSNLTCANQSMKAIKRVHPNLPRTQFESDLDEMDFGDYEGMTMEEVRSNRAQDRCTSDEGILRFEILKMGCDGGEFCADIEERSSNFMKTAQADLKDGLTRGKNLDILVFGHRKMFQCMSRLWKDPESGTRFQQMDFHFVIGDGEMATFTLDYENKFLPAIKLSGGFYIPSEYEEPEE